MKKKILALILIASMVFSLAGCGETKTEDIAVSVSTYTQVSTETKTVVSTVTETTVEANVTEENTLNTIPEVFDCAVTISINPEITLYIIENRVSHWVFNNDDAKDAYSELDFENVDAVEAIKTITATAIEKGYLKNDGKVEINLEPGTTEPSENFGVSLQNAAQVIMVEQVIDGSIVASVMSADTKKYLEEIKANSKVEEETAKEIEKIETKKNDTTSKKETTAQTKPSEVVTDPTPTPEPIPEPVPEPAPEVTPTPSVHTCTFNNVGDGIGREEYRINPSNPCLKQIRIIRYCDTCRAETVAYDWKDCEMIHPYEVETTYDEYVSLVSHYDDVYDDEGVLIDCILKSITEQKTRYDRYYCPVCGYESHTVRHVEEREIYPGDPDWIW